MSFCRRTPQVEIAAEAPQDEIAAFVAWLAEDGNPKPLETRYACRGEFVATFRPEHALAELARRGIKEVP